MLNVLASPVTRDFSEARYAKSYNVLTNLRADDVHVDTIVGYSETTVDPPTVSVGSLGTRTKLNYYQSVYRATHRRLKSGEYDIYHHMNFGYRWFNPLVLLDKIGNTPFVVGPAQAGHDILAEEFNGLVSKSLGLNIPRIATDPLHWVFEQCRDVSFDPIRFRLMEKTLERADRVVVVHHDAKEVYERHVDESKIEVVPLGVDPEKFPFRDRPENHNLVAVGALRERKGYGDLIEALATVRESVPDVHLDVFGDGPLEGELRAQADDIGVGDAVTFHGRVEQSVVREHLQTARAFVHPSHSESFSLVRLEAMSSGCPVIVSDIPGAEEMVRDGTDGYVVPRHSPESIAEAVTDLLDDYELAAEMGRNARERIEEKYTWSAIGDRYLDIYRDIA